MRSSSRKFHIATSVVADHVLEPFKDRLLQEEEARRKELLIVAQAEEIAGLTTRLAKAQSVGLGLIDQLTLSQSVNADLKQRLSRAEQAEYSLEQVSARLVADGRVQVDQNIVLSEENFRLRESLDEANGRWYSRLVRWFRGHVWLLRREVSFYLQPTAS
ncbi:MAG: hypothetical protein WC757_04525 [Candidatus Paceibacterota bacterium]|jgi:hypothetical protein